MGAAASKRAVSGWVGVLLGLQLACSADQAPSLVGPKAEDVPVAPVPIAPVVGNSSAPALERLPLITRDNTGWRSVAGFNRTTGVGVDLGGNLWVTAGTDGLYVRRAGSNSFAHHGTSQSAISVAGGPAGVAFVGYQGQPGCGSAWDSGGDASVYKSGDADRVELSGSGVRFSHYDIASGPGVVVVEPQGREKLCTIFRVVYDARTQSVWFGGNHGVAWGDPASTRVVEHTHPAINGYTSYAEDGRPMGYTLLSGDYYGLAVDAAGDLWLGGTERSARFRYASLGGDFWKADAEIQRTKVDVWPDARPVDPAPKDRVDDWVSGFAPVADGSVFASSLRLGLALIDKSGVVVGHYAKPLLDKRITVMKVDPADGSIWMGHAAGGMTRLRTDGWWHYGAKALGSLAQIRVQDIAMDTTSGRRKVWVAFSSGLMVFDGD